MLARNKDYYSTREAAEMLDVAVSTIQLWSNSGLLRTWKTVGGHRRIACNSVNEILSEQRIITKTGSEQILKVVIVDDDEQQIRIYEEQFSNLSIKTSIVIAEDPYQGLIKIGATLPHVIIGSLIFSNIDGFRMINSLKAIKELEEALIIAVADISEDEIKVTDELPKDVHLFTKPVHFKWLEMLLIKKIHEINQSRSAVESKTKNVYYTKTIHCSKPTCPARKV